MAIDLVARLNLEDNLTGPLGKIGGKMAGFVGFAAISAGATSAVKTFADFDSAMRKAATIAGATDSEFKQMSDSAKQLGADTSLSASEVANAMTEMAAKGYSATQVIDSMPGVIAAAEASGEDLATTADVVSTALNIWGMEASEATKVADILAMTANATAAGVTDMQYALKYAGAPAKALGISLEEVAAAAGLMSNAGIEGSTAGTALRQGLSMLVSPTKQTKKAMDALGFSATKSNGDVKSMVELVASLKDSMSGLSDSERISFMKDAVGTESMSAFLALVDAGPEKLAKLQKELENSDGSAQEAADKMKAGIGGALEEASGAIETFMIDIGDALAPTVLKFADFIANTDTAPIIASFQKLADKITVVAAFIITHFDAIKNAVVLASYAFIAFKAVGVIVRVVKTIISVFRVLKSALGFVKIAFNVLKLVMKATPFGWVITLVASLIAFAIKLAKNWDSTKSVWENVWFTMKKTAEDTVNSVINGINKMINLINKLPGVNIPVVANVNWTNDIPNLSTEGSVSNKTGASASTGTGQLLGNHAGISDVRGNTPRMLHDGERVLTKVENSVYKKALLGDSASLATIGGNGSVATNATTQSASAPVTNVTINMDGVTIREEADIKKLAKELTKFIS